jgi:pimeloyl-ACP methyl ester carboxylesterase
VASSYGAFVCLYLARQQPELVRALVLGEPPILPWLIDIPGAGDIYYRFGLETWQPAERAFQQGAMEQGVRLFIDGVTGAGTFDRLPPPARQAMMDNAPEMKLETSSADYFSKFTCEDAAQVTAPTLLVTGEHSPKMFHLITDEVERCLPNSQRASIPRTAHIMHVGNPQAYNEKVLEFLAKH